MISTLAYSGEKWFSSPLSMSLYPFLCPLQASTGNFENSGWLLCYCGVVCFFCWVITLVTASVSLSFPFFDDTWYWLVFFLKMHSARYSICAVTKISCSFSLRIHGCTYGFRWRLAIGLGFIISTLETAVAAQNQCALLIPCGGY